MKTLHEAMALLTQISKAGGLSEAEEKQFRWLQSIVKEANSKQRHQATIGYGSDDIEIDDDAVVSEGADDGYWVSAWVWVPDEEEGK